MAEDPLGLVIKYTVLGKNEREIAKELEIQGITITPHRVKTIQKRIGDEVFRFIREEYLDDAARTILDYRKQITSMTEWTNKRFIEAQFEYDEYRDNKHKSLTDILYEFQNDSAPNIAEYVNRISALQEGMTLQKLSSVMKNLSGDLAKWTEIAAKLDQKLAGDAAVASINVEQIVERVYSQLCDSCQQTLAGS